MNEERATALELDAAEVAAAPLLGYWIQASTRATAEQARISQPWIDVVNSPVTINLKKFDLRRPLDPLLVEGSAKSAFVPSLSDALANFRERWTISAELHDRIGASTATEALRIDGGDAEALVWRDGMVIGAHEPLATTLKLLIANFSETAREKYVYAKPQILACVLKLLPDDVKSRYVPGAESFCEQAEQQAIAEAHNVAFERQQRLKARAPKVKLIKPKEG